MNKKRILIISLIIIFTIGLVWIIKNKNGTKDNSSSNKGYIVNLGDNIYIERIYGYTGDFVEDGSDKEVSDVWTLKVTNKSKQDIQFLRIKATLDNNQGIFDITTLKSNTSVVVMESNASSLPNNGEEYKYSVENLAYFNSSLSLHLDDFKISTKDNWIQLENISEQDITNDIYVYYKNVEDDIYHGGITYRVKFSGGIKAGEIKQIQSKHCSSKNSEILNLTY